MALVEIGQLGRGGIVTDLPAFELPLQTWTDGLNVEFDRDGVQVASREAAVLGANRVNPFGLFPVTDSTNQQAWIYAGLEKIYSIQDDIHTDVTRTVGGDYSASEIVGWNGGILNGVPVLNNSIDVPQELDPDDFTAPATDLTNWPSTLRTSVLRPFGNFLIAIGASDTGVIFPNQTLIWSDPADPGEVPPSWDWADPATRAGVKTFSESEGYLVDGLGLRDEFMVYKTDAIWAMRFTGGTLVFSFKKRFDRVGLLAPGAVCSYNNFHFLVSKNDILIHNGVNIQSVADDVIRAKFFAEVNAEQISKVFCTLEEGKNRVWVFYPTNTSEWCNKAAIWNYKENTWTFREAPSVSAAASGYFDVDAGEVWDEDDATWNNVDNSRFWDGSPFGATKSNILMVSNVGAATYDSGTDTSTDGTVTWSGNTTYPSSWLVRDQASKMDGFVQKTAIAVAGKDHTGAPAVNRTVEKLFTEIWPEVTLGNVQVRVGAQATANGAITWEPYQTFDEIADIKVDVMVSSKFLAIEFKSTDALDAWMLSGYGMEVEKGARY